VGATEGRVHPSFSTPAPKRHIEQVGLGGFGGLDKPTPAISPASCARQTCTSELRAPADVYQRATRGIRRVPASDARRQTCTSEPRAPGKTLRCCSSLQLRNHRSSASPTRKETIYSDCAGGPGPVAPEPTPVRRRNNYHYGNTTRRERTPPRSFSRRGLNTSIGGMGRGRRSRAARPDSRIIDSS